MWWRRARRRRKKKARWRINLPSRAIAIRILVEEVCVKYARMANRCSRFSDKTSKTCNFVSLSQNREKKSVAFNPTRWNIYAPRSGRSNERGIQPGEKEWIEKSAFKRFGGAQVPCLCRLVSKYKTLNKRREEKEEIVEHVWFETSPHKEKYKPARRAWNDASSSRGKSEYSNTFARRHPFSSRLSVSRRQIQKSESVYYFLLGQDLSENGEGERGEGGRGEEHNCSVGG